MGDFIHKFSDNLDPAGTAGVLGTSTTYNGVLGVTTAEGHAGVAGVCDNGAGNGLYGRSANQHGVYGHSTAKYHGGVTGINDNASNEAGPGVYGKSKGTGVWGESETWHGVYGESHSKTGGAGVNGKNSKGKGAGVLGESDTGQGVAGISKNGVGVYGKGFPHAGIFDGNILINGSVFINQYGQNIDLVETINNFRNALAFLDQIVTRFYPKIEVLQYNYTGNMFLIEGSQFPPKKVIDIFINDRLTNPESITTMSDEEGKFGMYHTLKNQVVKEQKLKFIATDNRKNPFGHGDLIWTNEVVVTCQ